MGPCALRRFASVIALPARRPWPVALEWAGATSRAGPCRSVALDRRGSARRLRSRCQLSPSPPMRHRHDGGVESKSKAHSGDRPGGSANPAAAYLCCEQGRTRGSGMVSATAWGQAVQVEVALETRGCRRPLRNAVADPLAIRCACTLPDCLASPPARLAPGHVPLRFTRRGEWPGGSLETSVAHGTEVPPRSRDPATCVTS